MVPHPVLHDKYCAEVETTQVVTGKLNPTQSLLVIKTLKQRYLLEDLSHLKRIRSSKEDGVKVLEIIICEYNNEDKGNLIQCLFDDCLRSNITDLKVTEVPKSKPLTRCQFQEAVKIWPTSFHEDKNITKLQQGTPFSPCKLEKIEHFMHSAIECARLACSRGMRAVGAVIVNPESGEIIAKAYDCSNSCDSLKHAVMVSIDLVASLQGGGAFKLLTEEHESGCICLSEASHLNANQNSLPEMAPCSLSPLTQCNDLEGKLPCSLTQVDMHHDVLGSDGETLSKEKQCLKRKATNNSFESMYLCTGLDLYVTHEPCVMCAMALTHSRIRRVFYGLENKSMGGLGSHFKIHCQDSLNHHYEVFKDVLECQCLNQAWLYK